MFKKTKTSALANPVGRRAVLAKLGMVAGAAYAAPVLLSLSPAHASSSGGGSSSSGASAASANSYSAPSAQSAPSRNSAPSNTSTPSRNSSSGSSFSGIRRPNGRPGLAPNGMTWEEWWARMTGRG